MSLLFLRGGLSISSAHLASDVTPAGCKGTSIDFAGCDVVQIIPGYDPNGWFATLAASVAYKAVSLVVLRRLKCEMEAR